ncbi:MAG: hypothetical protein QOD82_6209 [Pseudonocardiales bacterium]|nr:hypothetical protein [Pseudonocardiales bacterium]MDT7678307.1 hypothetical protein [Pseudonocardiales bacterium]
MSVTTRQAELIGSAELASLLDHANQLAGATGRPDLIERLSRARARLAGRGMRVVLVGEPGQGATSLARVLDQVRANRLPGATFTDAPGRPGPNQARTPDPGSADVALFVTDAGHEYGQPELDALARLRAQGLAVVGVLTKIDIFPRWADVQRANRSRLQAANLDAPPIPLFPVSAALGESGSRGDESVAAASGVPQLVDFLRDRVGTKVEPALRDSVVAEIRAVTEELGRGWNGELDTVQSAGGSAQDRQQRAVAELDRRQQLSVNWQLALGDGATELMAQVDFDLRDRLRTVMVDAEAEILKASPVKQWPQFDAWVRGRVAESVQANFQLARERSRKLAAQVAAQLAGNPDGSHIGVALPDVRVNNPDEALRQIKPMPPLESSKGGVVARAVNSLRGSYGGVLMVGVLTSLAGMVLINVWSVAAGVLLGVFTFWEDAKNSKERGKAEARMAVSKLTDEANFRVGDDLRTQLRAVHRTLRDHFTVINDQRLRAAADTARTAADAAQHNGGQRNARLSELQNNLAELRQLQARLPNHRG